MVPEGAPSDRPADAVPAQAGGGAASEQNSRGRIRRVVTFGDSIAFGLGARGRAFPVVLAERLSVELLDLSATSMTVNYSTQFIGDCRSSDLVVIMHGITEAIPRVPPERTRWIPKRWAGPARMDPRPYFSTRRHRRMIERADSALRWRAKRLMMRGPTTVLMGADEYERQLATLVDSTARVAERVIVVAGTQINDRYFPGAQAGLDRYSDISRRVAERAGVTYLDLSPSLQRWDDFLADCFHPSTRGHEKIAEAILREVAR